MNKLEAFKLGSSVVVGVGVFKIVGGVVNTLIQQRNVLERAAVGSAQFVTSFLVAETTSRFIDRKTDEVIAWLDQSAKKQAEVE